jgi:hypothetical protein
MPEYENCREAYVRFPFGGPRFFGGVDPLFKP